MTEKLKSLMDRTADIEFAAVDLDRIVTDGDRTLRRRRGTLIVGGVAATALVAGAAVLALGVGQDRAGDPDLVTAQPVDSAGMNWALGGQILAPGAGIDVGHPVRAFVRTEIGFVAVGDDGRVRSVIRDDVMDRTRQIQRDQVSEIGRTPVSDVRIVADAEGRRVAWLRQGTGPEGWQVVVYDAVAEVSELGVMASANTRVVGIDGNELHLVTGDLHEVVDIEKPSDTWEIGPPVDGAELLAVQAGVLVWATGDGHVVERIGEAPVEIDDISGSTASLSPDGSRVTFDADQLQVYDTTTGDRIDLDVDGRVFASGYEWLDDDRLAVIASRSVEGPAELLACSVASGRCAQVVSDLGPFDDLVANGFALPLGTSLDDE